MSREPIHYKGLIRAIFIGLVSIPIIWGSWGNVAPNVELNAPELSETITTGDTAVVIEIPFWVITLLAMLVNLLLAFCARQVIWLPQILKWGIALVPAVLFTAGLISLFQSGILRFDTSLPSNVGLILAANCVYFPIYYLWSISSAMRASTAVEEEPLAS